MTASQFGPFSDAELEVMRADPACAFVAVVAAAVADMVSKTGSTNIPNARKHALWSALITQRMGAACAQKYTDAHESGQAGDETRMDLNNNEVGRIIGSRHPLVGATDPLPSWNDLKRILESQTGILEDVFSYPIECIARGSNWTINPARLVYLSDTCPRTLSMRISSVAIRSGATAESLEIPIGLTNLSSDAVNVRLRPATSLSIPGISIEWPDSVTPLQPRQALGSNNALAPRLKVTVQPGTPAFSFGVPVLALRNGELQACGIAPVRVTAGGDPVADSEFNLTVSGATPSSNSQASARVIVNGATSNLSWRGNDVASMRISLNPGPNTFSISLLSGTGIASYVLPEPFGSGRPTALGFIAHQRTWFRTTQNPVLDPPDYYENLAVKACSDPWG